MVKISQLGTGANTPKIDLYKRTLAARHLEFNSFNYKTARRRILQKGTNSAPKNTSQ